MVLLRQECYKAWHQGRVWIWWLIAFAAPLATATVIQLVPAWQHFKSEPDFFLITSKAALTVIFWSLIVVSATVIASEFSLGTIRPLLSRRFTRAQVWRSKLLFLVVHALVSAGVGLCSVLCAKYLFHVSAHFGQEYQGMLVINSIGASVLASALQSIFIVGIVVMTTSLLKNSALAICIGVLWWLGMIILCVGLLILMHFVPFVKWLPFNAYIGASSITLPSEAFQNITQLTQTQFGITFAVYTLIFYLLAYWIFSKRNV